MEVTEALQKCVPGGGICRQRCLWRRGEQCWGGVNLWRGVDRNEFRVANCKPETEVAIQRASSLFLTRFTSSNVRELGGSSTPPCEGVTHGRLWLFPSWLLRQNFAGSVGKFTASSPRWNAEGAMSCSSTVLTLVYLPDGDDALGAGKADIAFISVSMAATIVNHNFVSGPL